MQKNPKTNPKLKRKSQAKVDSNKNTSPKYRVPK